MLMGSFSVCVRLCRCGMIYMEPHQLGWTPLRDSYINTLPATLASEHRKLVGVYVKVEVVSLVPCTCAKGFRTNFLSVTLTSTDHRAV